MVKRFSGSSEEISEPVHRVSGSWVRPRKDTNQGWQVLQVLHQKVLAPSDGK